MHEEPESILVCWLLWTIRQIFEELLVSNTFEKTVLRWCEWFLRKTRIDENLSKIRSQMMWESAIREIRIFPHNQIVNGFLPSTQTSSAIAVFSLDSFSCFSSSVWEGLEGPEELVAELIAWSGDVMLLVSFSLLHRRLVGMSGSGFEGWLEWLLASMSSAETFLRGFAISWISWEFPSGNRWDLTCSGLGLTGMFGKAFVGLVSEFDRDVVRGLMSGGRFDWRIEGLGGDSIGGDFDDLSSLALSCTLLWSEWLNGLGTGTVRMISHRLIPTAGDERDLLKCDVQFFCFSMSSFELNFLSGFSGFSGFSNFSRDTFWIMPRSFFPPPFVMPVYFFFGDGVFCRSGLGSFKLSSLLVECLMLKVVGRLIRPSPSFSNKARAWLNRAACDSVRITAFPPAFGSLSSSEGLRWKMLAIWDTFGPGGTLLLSIAYSFAAKNVLSVNSKKKMKKKFESIKEIQLTQHETLPISRLRKSHSNDISGTLIELFRWHVSWNWMIRSFSVKSTHSVVKFSLRWLCSGKFCWFFSHHLSWEVFNAIWDRSGLVKRSSTALKTFYQRNAQQESFWM